MDLGVTGTCGIPSQGSGCDPLKGKQRRREENLTQRGALGQKEVRYRRKFYSKKEFPVMLNERSQSRKIPFIGSFWGDANSLELVVMVA